MPRCPKCNYPMPEACPACPPRVTNCPNCGEPLLIEPANQAMHEEIMRRYRERHP